MQNTGKLAGKTIFITGGSRGIGKAIALKAAKDKANIIIAAKTADPHPKLEGTIFSAAKEIEAAGGQCLPVQVDVREEGQVQEAVDKAVKQFGGLDILVNNASAIFLAGTQETPMKRYDLMNQINARGTYLTSKICIPHLLKSKNPHILNLSPPLNLNPVWFKGNLAYTMAKYGMSMCVLGMSAEFRDEAVWTAAMEMMTGDESSKKCRKPEICADAFYAIVTQDSRKFTGNFCIDDKVLADAGITDFEQYAVEPGQELMPDFFLDAADGMGGIIREQSDKAFAAKARAENAASKGKPQSHSAGGGGENHAAIFDAIGQHIKAKPDPKLKGTYVFQVGEKSWFLNVENGDQGEGEAPSGKPIATLSMNDADFLEIFSGKLQSATAYMSGRLKIKGDMGAAMKLDKLLAQKNKK
ncbi:Hydroxysteroid dehydrogenase-like protein 2 [Hypsibius exemplaris]|uniref:Hydroxysteroid dehydrogenase-like protein 2 n=1 Tax=Hypsibius exemplaris TaxID=2072580 RepID=A0A1W0XEH1_HYPEX|nr:Hydroxysteroid dehydrogenase-like protein 2 [Hypsibius exemplaris]